MSVSLLINSIGMHHHNDLFRYTSSTGKKQSKLLLKHCLVPTNLKSHVVLESQTVTAEENAGNRVKLNQAERGGQTVKGVKNDLNS